MTLITTTSVQPFALYDGDLAASNTNGSGAINTAWLVGATLRVPATLTAMRVRFGSGGAGHYDAGVYSDVNGVPTTLLAHVAATSTTLATATGVQSPALIGGNLVLQAGRYWLALWVDNATDTILREVSGGNMQVVQSGTNAGPLPAAASSLTGLANATFKPVIIGLLLNGWS